MVLGIGADIVASDRFKKLKDKEGFLSQVFSPEELSRAPKANRDRFYASLFAIKESVLKALGCGLSRGALWHDIQISKNNRVSLSGWLLEMLPDGDLCSVHVSASGTREYAIAYVIIETTI
ncbi:holo-ACP synthase [candidate division TA06 bacterium]|uniref:Holo-[acyl-carrier-protein] synthase n=1 Tax=candidate division TA06 bacterium TaxID=2250710 RepID=A0A933MKT5_UNCT6|nr:holo-ACP synthase [candidate division TA06 bacterium]